MEMSFFELRMHPVIGQKVRINELGIESIAIAEPFVSNRKANVSGMIFMVYPSYPNWWFVEIAPGIYAIYNVREMYPEIDK